MDFDDILIKLKRHYGKDEVVSALSKKLSEAEILIGQLKSEIDFLQSELQSDKEQKEINRISKIESRKDELMKMKTNQINSLKDQNKKLINQRNDLISKCNKHNIL